MGITKNTTQESIANAVSTIGLMERLQQWNKNLKVQRSAEGDSVIAIIKSIDLTADDLRELADLVDTWTVTFGRSGANFRMIIW